MNQPGWLYFSCKAFMLVIPNNDGRTSKRDDSPKEEDNKSGGERRMPMRSGDES